MRVARQVAPLKIGWTVGGWLRFAIVFLGVLVLTLLRGEDPRRDRSFDRP